MRQFAQRLFSRIPRSYASLFPILSVVVVGFISWYEATQGGHSSAAHTIMAILSRMDKAVATAAVFSITILEGGGMVLAKYFREEGEATGLEKGREESRAEIERVKAENQRIQAENQQVRADKEKDQAQIEALQKRVQEFEARNGNKPGEE